MSVKYYRFIWKLVIQTDALYSFFFAQVGTNLTDLTLRKRRVTVRELGGCMGPIWPSYFQDCTSVIFMVDSANIAQISSSCIQLLCVLSAAPLRSASVLLLFNKRSDWPFLLFCFFKRALCFSSNSNKHRENQEQKYFTRLDIFVHWSLSLKRFERIYLLITTLLHVYIVYVWA